MDTPPPRFCFFGASTTEGMGDVTRRGWVGNLSIIRDTDAAYYNLGVRSQTLLEIGKRAEDEVKYRLPENAVGRIVIGCPLNDIAYVNGATERLSDNHIIRRLSRLVLKLQEITPVFVVGPPPAHPGKMPYVSVAQSMTWDFRNDEIELLDKQMSNWCAENSVPYAPVFTELIANDTFMNGLASNDGLHTDENGYVAWAKIIDAQLSWQGFIAEIG
ncbi:MAG: GDSL-type esterase/lipase family protein [Pseudomonadota bacterium]